MRTVIFLAILEISEKSNVSCDAAKTEILFGYNLKTPKKSICPKDRRATTVVIRVRRRDFKNVFLKLIYFNLSVTKFFFYCEKFYFCKRTFRHLFDFKIVLWTDLVIND